MRYIDGAKIRPLLKFFGLQFAHGKVNERLDEEWNVFLQYSLVNISDNILFSIYSDIDKSVVWHFGWCCGYGHATWQLRDLKL
ncbi:hypothetical protein [Neisseria cinerea]|uniref:hypothetical protein n=1 Tax=Neisseria cinerea TaxID=483 RepID=UPI00288B7B5B|nr:hypothetical protein [Neisseria cinerea]